MQNNKTVIYLGSPVRTPIGKFGGALRSESAVDLAAASARESLKRSGAPLAAIDEVIIGTARQAGLGPNPARQVVQRLGLPDSVPGLTVNQACASGLRAIISAAQGIATGTGRVILAGGTESMSNIPYLVPGARWGHRLGHQTLVDANYQDGYFCPLCDHLMGETAENLAAEYDITREESDKYALSSQLRCAEATARGSFHDEVIPVEAKDRRGRSLLVETDEHPSPLTTLDDLSRLPSVFQKDGTVHAGNASGITDGAATVIVFSEEAGNEYGLQPMAQLLDYVTVGVDPAMMGIGPVPAVREILRRNNLALDDLDLVELNEAFAVQVLACDRDLNLDFDKVNVNGGAIALGHPTGCTGVRIVVTLLHEMARRDAELGLATLCVSGGLGVAALFKRV